MALWDILLGPIVSIINKVIPDKAAAAAAISQLQQLEAQGALETEKSNSPASRARSRMSTRLRPRIHRCSSPGGDPR